MKKSRHREFFVRPDHRAGMKRAVQWHDYMGKIFRNAIASRIAHNFPVYGELLWKAEEHERAAKELRDLSQPPEVKERLRRKGERLLAKMKRETAS